MGAGVAYPYDYFMLMDEDETVAVRSLIEAWAPNWVARGEERVAASRTAFTILSAPRFWVGIDYGGGTPCVYAMAKQCEMLNRPYVIKTEIGVLFNHLIRRSLVKFSVATSAWTSKFITRYEPNNLCRSSQSY